MMIPSALGLFWTELVEERHQRVMKEKVQNAVVYTIGAVFVATHVPGLLIQDAGLSLEQIGLESEGRKLRQFGQDINETVTSVINALIN